MGLAALWGCHPALSTQGVREGGLPRCLLPLPGGCQLSAEPLPLPPGPAAPRQLLRHLCAPLRHPLVQPHPGESRPTAPPDPPPPGRARRRPSSPFQLQVLPTPTAPGPVWGPGVLEGSGDFQPPTASPPQDLLPSFLVTLLVPLAVAAVLCVVLGHLMCCRREGV